MGLMSLAMQGCHASRSSATLPVDMESVSVLMCVTVRTGGQEMTVGFHSASEHTHTACPSLRPDPSLLLPPAAPSVITVTVLGLTSAHVFLDILGLPVVIDVLARMESATMV